MKLTMVGTGYVGLVTGACLANIGNDVICLDVDPAKIEKLTRGGCPIHEPGLGELMRTNVDAGRLRFTLDKHEAYKDARMIFICVGTPSDGDGHPDLSYVLTAADDIADTLVKLGTNQQAKTIVVKSTVPVGTTFRVKERIRRRVGAEIPFHVADNPEFLKEGAAIADFNKPDRVVCGVEDEETGELFRDLYDPFVRNGRPVFLMDILSAELVKYASNNFLATKISFINEIANLCEAYGADVVRVREGMCSDRRIGYDFLHPGLGYGGSCFPKDTQACIRMGQTSDTPVDISRAVHETNLRQRERFWAKIEGHFDSRGGLKGKTLAFWGLAFKPHTDDVREAPALVLIRRALEAGSLVRCYDAVAIETARDALGAGPTFVGNMYDAAENADAIVISTDWDEFKSPDLDRLATIMASKTIFDGRNLLRRQSLGRCGFFYYCVGRTPVVPG